jgi:hypothetical protein
MVLAVTLTVQSKRGTEQRTAYGGTLTMAAGH